MMDAQAQDRAHRIGQKNEVRVFRLVTTSLVEERILARATDKRNLNGLVVEAGKFNNKAGKYCSGRFYTLLFLSLSLLLCLFVC